MGEVWLYCMDWPLFNMAFMRPDVTGERSRSCWITGSLQCHLPMMARSCCLVFNGE